jgi:hypothetical protein
VNSSNARLLLFSESVLRSGVHQTLEANVADNRKKAGRADRARVSTKQKYEVAYEARKMGVSKQAVVKAAKKVGPMRKKIEAELTKTKAKAAKKKK